MAHASKNLNHSSVQPWFVAGLRFMDILVGILGNNGAIYPDSSQKAAHFIQLCNQTDTPIIFLQNVTGFLVGKDFESAWYR